MRHGHRHKKFFYEHMRGEKITDLLGAMCERDIIPKQPRHETVIVINVGLKYTALRSLTPKCKTYL